jgi:NarL family two-component system response regulator LiaR
MKKIIIADDHALIREGIKTVLKNIDHYELAGEASNGLECIQILKAEPVDILILDIDMPEKNGVDVGRWVRSMQLNIQIIYITSHTDFFTFFQAWKLNPAGFLFKENALEELSNCLQHIENGKKYYASETNAFLKENEEKVKAYEVIFDKMKSLSAKEKQILLFIAENKTTNEIAESLFNSYKTIENHRYNIAKKLDISGSNNLMRFALNNYDIIKSQVSDQISNL